MIVFNQLGKLGQLGNQLFQIAATITHAKKMGVNAQFPQWEYNKYLLNPIDDQLDTTYDEKYQNVVYETHFQGKAFHYEPIPEIKNLILLGFFQSEKFFDESIVKHHLKPKNEFLQVVRKAGADFLHLQNLIAVHVRRGDYLDEKNIGYHPVLPIDYYLMGISAIKSNYGNNVNIVIFSDDMEWCKTQFNDANTYFAQGNSNIVDLYLMAHCKHHIIANSSFSWWGAWLKKLFVANPGCVIAPYPWFGPQSKNDTADLYCSDWKKLIRYK